MSTLILLYQWRARDITMRQWIYMAYQLFWPSDLESIYNGYIDIKYSLALKPDLLIREFGPDNQADTIVIADYFLQCAFGFKRFVAGMPGHPDDTIDVWLENIGSDDIVGECVRGEH